MLRSAVGVALLMISGLCPIAVSIAAERVISVPQDFRSIQEAVDAAGEGDTVLVAAGTYRDRFRVKGKKVVVASRYLTSRDPTDVENTVLDGSSESGKRGPTLITIDDAAGSSLRLVGFTVRGSDHAVVNTGHIEAIHNRFLGNTDAVSFENARGIVRFNLFEGDNDDGVDMDGGSEAIIEDNIFRDNRDDGIEIRLHKYSGTPLDIVIRRNVFSGNREDGLQLIDYPGKSARSIRVERNVFANNAMAGIGSMADGNTKENFEGADLLESVQIINNTFVGSRYGVTGGDNMLLVNNVFLGAADAAVKRVHGDSFAGVNLFWKNGSDTEDCDLGGDKFIRLDPRLDRDHRPADGGPCIDAGAETTKYNGEILILPAESYRGAAPDLGAFEVGK
jgi:hypothetical protein